MLDPFRASSAGPLLPQSRLAAISNPVAQVANYHQQPVLRERSRSRRPPCQSDLLSPLPLPLGWPLD